jgi:RimJ/RimL family protein N-acetyltransferase
MLHWGPATIEEAIEITMHMGNKATFLPPGLPYIFYAAKEDEKLIGGIQLYWGHAPFGVVGVACARWGKSTVKWPMVQVMKEMLLQLPDNIQRLEAAPAAENRLARANLERAGFLFEGILKKWYIRLDGTATDAAMYGLSRGK